MNKPSFWRRVLATAALAAAAAGCVITVDGDAMVVREERRFSVGAAPDVTLETWDGSIRVQSWDRPEVLVEIEKRGPDRGEAAALVVNATQEGDRVRLEAPAPRVQREFTGINIGSFSGLSVSYVASVPRSVKLTAHTRDGSIVVESVSGTVDLRSGDGSIRASDVTGELRARTGDGSVLARDVGGRVSVESGDGSLQVTGRLETLHAETGDGSVVVEAAQGSAPHDDWDIVTGDGSIVFRVPDDFSAEIDAESRDGRVRGELPGLERVRGEGGRESLRGRLGAGGPTVTLRTGDGSIRVLNR